MELFIWQFAPQPILEGDPALRLVQLTQCNYVQGTAYPTLTASQVHILTSRSAHIETSLFCCLYLATQNRTW